VRGERIDKERGKDGEREREIARDWQLGETERESTAEHCRIEYMTRCTINREDYAMLCYATRRARVSQ